MTYHLGTVLNIKEYGYWQVSDPAVADRLRAAGLMIPPVDTSKGPTFVGIVDMGGSNIAIEVRSSGVFDTMRLPAELVAEFRAKLASAMTSIASIPTFNKDVVSRMAPLPNRFGAGAGRPVQADQPPVAPPPPVPPPAPVPPAPRATSEMPAPPAPPVPAAVTNVHSGRSNSNTGLYIGLGVAAAAVAALVFWPRNR